MRFPPKQLWETNHSMHLHVTLIGQNTTHLHTRLMHFPDTFLNVFPTVFTCTGIALDASDEIPFSVPLLLVLMLLHVIHCVGNRVEKGERAFITVPAKTLGKLPGNVLEKVSGEHQERGQQRHQ